MRMRRGGATLTNWQVARDSAVNPFGQRQRHIVAQDRVFASTGADSVSGSTLRGGPGGHRMIATWGSCNMNWARWRQAVDTALDGVGVAG